MVVQTLTKNKAHSTRARTHTKTHKKTRARAGAHAPGADPGSASGWTALSAPSPAGQLSPASAGTRAPRRSGKNRPSSGRLRPGQQPAALGGWKRPHVQPGPFRADPLLALETPRAPTFLEGPPERDPFPRPLFLSEPVPRRSPVPNTLPGPPVRRPPTSRGASGVRPARLDVPRQRSVSRSPAPVPREGGEARGSRGARGRAAPRRAQKGGADLGRRRLRTHLCEWEWKHDGERRSSLAPLAAKGDPTEIPFRTQRRGFNPAWPQSASRRSADRARSYSRRTAPDTS